jgi:hypothetical protein
MIRIRAAAVAALAVAVLGLSAWVDAQVMTSAARHVRSVPIQSGRLVSAPITDAVGSFSPLRSNANTINVFGIVQNHMGVLVPSAGVVVVRELLTGRVVGTTEVNELAQFSFRSLPPGLYTAELVGRSGGIIASTPAFSAAIGEVIQLSQTIPAIPLQGFARAAASATSSALSSAASTGVLAITPGVAVSSGQ